MKKLSENNEHNFYSALLRVNRAQLLLAQALQEVEAANKRLNEVAEEIELSFFKRD